jgi:hypothetical protein
MISRAVAVLGALMIAITAATASDATSCKLPQELRRKIEMRYPGMRLVDKPALNEYDRQLFEKEHDGDCPGAANVDFYGDGKPTIALILLEASANAHEGILLVAHEVDGAWRLRVLDKVDAPLAPVVWGENPGEYTDVSGNRTIKAHHEPVVLCRYEAWAVLYALDGKMVKKIWIAD